LVTLPVALDASIRRLVVIDLEATTSNDGALPRDEMETIEIGAVLVDVADLSIQGEFQCFVRPVRHPTLLAFCTELTGISQDMLADAPRFPEAMASLLAAMPLRAAEVAWGSWGKFDDTQLRRDCAWHGMDYPMPPHVNLKATFGAGGRRRRVPMGMAEALRRCGLNLEGAHHRALDDARNISRLLPWVFGRVPWT
jgi:inhibitor of KinA sporulation pathway (predicted exonuclease)